MRFLDDIFRILLIVGGLNWGLVGLSNYDVIVDFFGVGTEATRIVYLLVGVAALYNLFFYRAIRNRCSGR